jgi:hypothetical protein
MYLVCPLRNILRVRTNYLKRSWYSIHKAYIPYTCMWSVIQWKFCIATADEIHKTDGHCAFTLHCHKKCKKKVLCWNHLQNLPSLTNTFFPVYYFLLIVQFPFKLNKITSGTERRPLSILFPNQTSSSCLLNREENLLKSSLHICPEACCRKGVGAGGRGGIE